MCWDGFHALLQDQSIRVPDELPMYMEGWQNATFEVAWHAQNVLVVTRGTV